VKQLIAWAKAQGPQAVFGSAPGKRLAVPLPGHLGQSGGRSEDDARAVQGQRRGPDRPGQRAAADDDHGLSPQVELHKAGKIKLLAVSGEQRSPLVPDVPTLKEAGVNLSSSTSTGLFGPPRMAPELVQRYYAAVQPSSAMPPRKRSWRSRACCLGRAPAPSSPLHWWKNASASKHWSRPADGAGGWLTLSCRAHGAVHGGVPIPLLETTGPNP
jgi:hypothetical protein